MEFFNIDETFIAKVTTKAMKGEPTKKGTDGYIVNIDKRNGTGKIIPGGATYEGGIVTGRSGQSTFYGAGSRYYTQTQMESMFNETCR